MQESRIIISAKVDFNQALALVPQRGGFLNNRSRIWLVKGDPERALIDIEQALKLDPLVAEAWMNRRIVKVSREDFAEAITNYTQALKLNPQLVNAYRARGITYLLLDKLKEAEADLARYRELGGTLPPETAQLLREVRQKRSKQQSPKQ